MDVLIVEDDPTGGEWMQALIARWQHRSEWVETGQAAVDRLSRKQFDLILLDIFLPDGQGDTFIPRIKTLCPRGHIVAMTGFSTREMETRIRKQGIAYYLIKPLDLKHLESIVDHISLKKAAAAAA
jgi:DNA-binding response OmpR family regulator